MKIVVFDIGGVLRASKTRDVSKDELKRNYESACAMYKTFVDSPDWEVIVVTQKSKKKTYKQVVEELKGLGLPEPDDIRITYDDKEVHYKELKPDVVFDDNFRWIKAAAKHGAFTCHVVL